MHIKKFSKLIMWPVRKVKPDRTNALHLKAVGTIANDSCSLPS